MKKLLFITFLLTQGSLVEAWTAGPGSQRCGKILTNIEKFQEFKDFYGFYAQGYVSGLDRGNGLDKADIDFDSLLLSIKKRCEEEPTEYYANAIEWVYYNKL